MRHRSKWLGPVAAGVAGLALPAAAFAQQADLTAECERVYAVHPRLMLAAMLEGDANCGEPGADEFVSCDEGETLAEKAARERRLAIREHQEAGYRVADEACRNWEANKRDTSRIDALGEALAAARKTDTWQPDDD